MRLPNCASRKNRSTRCASRSSRQERAHDLQKAAELRYGKLRTLEAQMQQAEDRGVSCKRRARCSKKRSMVKRLPRLSANGLGFRSLLMQGERQKLVQLENVLHKRHWAGRSGSCSRRSHSPQPCRSAGSQQADWQLHLLGPTGVGKTELARSLADFLFDSDQSMIRIDMSEYQERHCFTFDWCASWLCGL